jgi:hypothetical protein
VVVLAAAAVLKVVVVMVVGLAAAAAAVVLQEFSLFASVAALSHCLCSESPYLSIKFTVFMFAARISRYM